MWAGAIFQDSVAIVTGASGGIGRATVMALAGKGAYVGLVSRSGNRLESLAQEIKKRYGREALVLPTDVCSKAQIDRTVGQVIKRFGRIDYLINGAGIITYKPFLSLTEEEESRMMAVNYFGTVATTRSVLPTMIRQGQGHIVNIASTAGRRGFPMETGYCASKFAVVGFSEALRLELDQTGVRISVLSPGIVDTALAESFLGQPRIRDHVKPLTSDEIARRVLGMVLRNRPEEILPAATRWLIRVNSFTPRLADWIIRRRLKRIHRLLSGGG